MLFFRTFFIVLTLFGLFNTVYSEQTSTISNPTQVHPAKLNINKATLNELMAIKGITKSKAKSIVAYYKKHGDFKSLDDLKKVRGFKKLKPEQLKNIQDQLTIS
jgi:competence protein ComEA